MIKLNTEFDLKERSRIQKIITHIELLLANWGKLASASDHSTVVLVDDEGTLWDIDVDCGLCAGAWLQQLPKLDGGYYTQNGTTLHYRMFHAFYACDPDVTERGYVFGENEYLLEYYGNKYANPLRQDLAEHCVEYLKEFIDV